MSVCVCACACELPYGEKWEEIGGLKRRKGPSASSVAVFQIEIFDLSPEKRAAWIFKMPFWGKQGERVKNAIVIFTYTHGCGLASLPQSKMVKMGEVEKPS